jgi:kynurenine formamidase
VSKPERTIIDLSVPVSPDHWEPEPVKRRVVDHRDGADKLGRSYLYFHATGLWQRLKAKLLQPKQYFIDHRDFPDQMGLSLMFYELTTHTGTHVDAPYHYGWRAGRKDRPATVTDIPLSWCYGAGVLLDFSGDEDAPIDDFTVQAKLADIGHVIAEGDIVLINTGAARLTGQREYFTQYRAIERSAVRWLVENGVRVIGTDAFSFDRPFCQMIDDYKRTGDNDHLWPSHFFGRDRPYLQIERLGQLDELPSPTGFQVCCFPIKLDKADAAWSRVVAIMDG